MSTRRVDGLVQAMGLSGISKSQVSELCKEIDERVPAFRDRPLAGDLTRGETSSTPKPGVRQLGRNAL